MIKLCRISGSDFIVECVDYGIRTQGDRYESAEALFHCGVDEGEIEMAFAEFERCGHTHALFGVNKTLIYTRCEAESLRKAAA
jgi:hypothetical protein